MRPMLLDLIEGFFLFFGFCFFFVSPADPFQSAAQSSLQQHKKMLLQYKNELKPPKIVVT